MTIRIVGTRRSLTSPIVDGHDENGSAAGPQDSPQLTHLVERALDVLERVIRDHHVDSAARNFRQARDDVQSPCLSRASSGLAYLDTDLPARGECVE